MRKKRENLHKRKEGVWEDRSCIDKANKKPFYHSIYGKTYMDVKEKEDYYIHNKKYRNIFFEDILDMWIEQRLFYQKESTRLKYMNMINTHIKPELGLVEINKLDDVMINEFLFLKKKAGRIDKKGGLSDSYIKTMAIIINSALRYAVEKDYRLPLKSKIQKPSINKKEIHVLSEKIQNQLENVLFDDTSKTALGILIALNTGIRIGEICALKWENIDLQNKVIRIRSSVIRVSASENSLKKTKYIISEPKTKTSIRDIPITSKLYAVLQKQDIQEKKVFVLSDNKDFLCPRTFEYRFHQILRQYAIPDTNFHTLRHTFATRCVEKNVDTKTLCEILGHSNVSVTLNYYVHPSFEAKRIQLEKICTP